MTDQVGADRYRRLFERLGDARAREIIDKLQVVALTDLDALHELETFLERGLGAKGPGASQAPVPATSQATPTTDRIDDPDRGKID
jgi:hypothetical protein